MTTGILSNFLLSHFYKFLRQVVVSTVDIYFPRLVQDISQIEMHSSALDYSHFHCSSRSSDPLITSQNE